MGPFCGGLILGGVFSGVIVGAAGGIASVIPGPVRLGLLAIIVAVLMPFELAGRPLSLPQNRRLVPQTVIPRAQVEGPLQFGFEMGTGVRTFVPTALPHALVATVVLAGGILPGLLAGLGFGLGRVLMPVTRVLSGRPQDWDDELLGSLAWVGRACAIAYLLALTTLLAQLNDGRGEWWGW